jgi:hypothetical protein
MRIVATCDANKFVGKALALCTRYESVASLSDETRSLMDDVVQDMAKAHTDYDFVQLDLSWKVPVMPIRASNMRHVPRLCELVPEGKLTAEQAIYAALRMVVVSEPEDWLCVLDELLGLGLELDPRSQSIMFTLCELPDHAADFRPQLIDWFSPSDLERKHAELHSVFCIDPGYYIVKSE